MLTPNWLFAHPEMWPYNSFYGISLLLVENFMFSMLPVPFLDILAVQHVHNFGLTCEIFYTIGCKGMPDFTFAPCHNGAGRVVVPSISRCAVFYGLVLYHIISYGVILSWHVGGDLRFPLPPPCSVLLFPPPTDPFRTTLRCGYSYIS